ncbi:type II toxin-antitoxin system PemK/MazF family toxin [Flavobacterium sp.]|jgi:mRNA interferase MazF|uniref:type II toxin-antitoxin system PemK/MazF family toxin n=1 Tax=Flavobacterium sp. TaxID=239 RepID=UPI0037BE2139
MNQFEIWLADLNPQIGTEAGKVRPVIIVQTNFLNEIRHPSTIVCPITTKLNNESSILRIRINNGNCGLTANSDIMIDQIRSIDNSRFVKKIGIATNQIKNKIKENILNVLDF